MGCQSYSFSLMNICGVIAIDSRKSIIIDLYSAYTDEKL